MKRSSQVSGDRLPVLITLAVFLVLVACLPVVRWLDTGIDSDRPMYHDMERMQGLQAAYIATGEPPVEVELREGESVDIGATEFTVSDGVTLAVRAEEGYAFCVVASNEDGATAERCTE